MVDNERQPDAATPEVAAEQIQQIYAAFFAKTNMTMLLDQLPLGLWVKDASGRYVGANQQWIDDESFDSVDEIASKNDYDLFEPVRAAANIRRDWEMLDEARPLITADQVSRPGNSETIRTTRMPLRDEDQKTVGIIGLTQCVGQTAALPVADPALDIDPITGVGLKTSLLDRIEEVLGSEQPSSVLVLCLDDHRIVCDSLGLEFGDMLLRAAARRLTTAFGPLLFRNRADEFAVVVPTTDPKQLADMGEMLLSKWRQPLSIDGNHIYGAISIGIAKLTDRTRARLVLQDAELAVDDAKRNGGNQVAIYSSEHRSDADDQLAQQMLVRRAVADKEFDLHWQPIVDAATRRPRRLEALLRWRPAGGARILPAAEFLPFLERSGLIVQLGQYVIDEACRCHVTWREHRSIKESIPVHVNVSERQFSSGLLARDVLHSLDKHNVAPQMFTVEVNESAVVNPSQEMLRDLMELREAGVSIAVDDFGASHASLVSLSNLPIDIAKIDRRLTSRIVPGENEPILDALRTVLTTHGVTPIVQGVEDETQAEWLNARGWQLLQGYYVGSPADPHDLTPLLAEQLAT